MGNDNAVMKFVVEKLDAVVKAVEFRERVNAIYRGQGDDHEAARQVAAELVRKTKAEAAAALTLAGYPRIEPHRGHMVDRHFSDGSASSESVGMEKLQSLSKHEQRLYEYRAGEWVFRTYAEAPGKWDSVRVEKEPAKDDEPTVGLV